MDGCVLMSNYEMKSGTGKKVKDECAFLDSSVNGIYILRLKD